MSPRPYTQIPISTPNYDDLLKSCICVVKSSQRCRRVPLCTYRSRDQSSSARIEHQRLTYQLVNCFNDLDNQTQTSYARRLAELSLCHGCCRDGRVMEVAGKIIAQRREEEAFKARMAARLFPAPPSKQTKSLPDKQQTVIPPAFLQRHVRMPKEETPWAPQESAQPITNQFKGPMLWKHDDPSIAAQPFSKSLPGDRVATKQDDKPSRQVSAPQPLFSERPMLLTTAIPISPSLPEVAPAQVPVRRLDWRSSTRPFERPVLQQAKWTAESERQTSASARLANVEEAKDGAIQQHPHEEHSPATQAAGTASKPGEGPFSHMSRGKTRVAPAKCNNGIDNTRGRRSVIQLGIDAADQDDANPIPTSDPFEHMYGDKAKTRLASEVYADGVECTRRRRSVIKLGDQAPADNVNPGPVPEPSTDESKRKTPGSSVRNEPGIDHTWKPGSPIQFGEGAATPKGDAVTVSREQDDLTDSSKCTGPSSASEAPGAEALGALEAQRKSTNNDSRTVIHLGKRSKVHVRKSAKTVCADMLLKDEKGGQVQAKSLIHQALGAFKYCTDVVVAICTFLLLSMGLMTGWALLRSL